MKKDDKKRCGICEIPYFERNNFYFGKLMTVRDFSAEQCYFNEKRWLINRMVNGWGVVCGLDVYEKDGKVYVKPGLAIDCCGREILVCEEQEVKLVPEESHCLEGKEEKEEELKNLAVCIEFHECKTEVINISPAACDRKEKHEFNRIRDAFKIRVFPFHDNGPQHNDFCPHTAEDKSKSLDKYICDRLREGCPECPHSHCLVLATLTVDQDGGLVGEIDACSRRKILHSNPVLYDLINCFHGDLPHVIGINWKENGAGIKWDDFEKGIYKQGVQVMFDRKMNKDTINGNTFSLQVKMEDLDTGNYRYEQIPGKVSYKYDAGTGESTAIFEVTSEWLYDVYFGYSRIREKGAEFLVVLKGDFILSSGDNGNHVRALDGNFIGGKLPSGNGTQGGDFISWFFVAPPEEEKKRKRRRRRTS